MYELWAVVKSMCAVEYARYVWVADVSFARSQSYLRSQFSLQSTLDWNYAKLFIGTGKKNTPIKREKQQKLYENTEALCYWMATDKIALCKINIECVGYNDVFFHAEKEEKKNHFVCLLFITRLGQLSAAITATTKKNYKCLHIGQS